MQKANQRIQRYYIKLPNSATSQDVVSVINAIKSNTVVPPTPYTYEARRKEALPFFRMFTRPSTTKKKVFDIYGKNIFRLFQN